MSGDFGAPDTLTEALDKALHEEGLDYRAGVYLRDLNHAWELFEPIDHIMLKVFHDKGRWGVGYFYDGRVYYSGIDYETLQEAVCVAWLEWRKWNGG